MPNLLCHAEDDSLGVIIDLPSSHGLPHVDAETEVESHNPVLSQIVGAILEVY